MGKCIIIKKDDIFYKQECIIIDEVKGYVTIKLPDNSVRMFRRDEIIKKRSIK